MTQTASVGDEKSAHSDPLDDILDAPSRRQAERSRTIVRRVARPAPVWPVALMASLVWIAAVAAFCWSHFNLPPSLNDAIEIAGTRITMPDWLMIAAALLAPLLLIWLIAWIVRRSNEMRVQTQELAATALGLAHAAREVQSPEILGLPAPTLSELSGSNPGHLRREVERASHAVSALHSQMRSIEEALSRQAAAIDDVAERAEKRARAISATLGTERAALASVTEKLESVSLERASEDKMQLRAKQADAVDLSLATPEIEAAQSEWLTNLDPSTDREEPRVSIPEISTSEEKLQESPLSVSALAARAAVAGTALTGNDDETVAPRVDPFDDLGAAAEEIERDDDTVEIETDAAFGEEVFTRARKNPVDWLKFIRAANFPESEDDTETLDALYEVLTDPEAASLLQSAEDTLATLADLDLYMEDFRRELAPVSDWKVFLDEKSLKNRSRIDIDAHVEIARIQSKFATDGGFHRLGTKFSERYEAIITRMTRETETPQNMVELSDTRTGRAYLLVSQALAKFSPPVQATSTG